MTDRGRDQGRAGGSAPRQAANRFAISIDVRLKLLRVDFNGFLAPGDVASYAVAKDAAIAKLGCPPNHHVTLCDFTASPAQSQEVLGLLKQTLDDPVTRSRRLAVVVGSALTRMQAQRVVTRTDAAVFLDGREAMTWLLAD